MITLAVLGINATAKPNFPDVQFLELFAANVSLLSWNSVIDIVDLPDKRSFWEQREEAPPPERSHTALQSISLTLVHAE